ncbi:hypothetical protein BU24DRAFT_414480 [Aaosphaeria arxii CBS 175.79]|uniref:Uncharacterized protein n=1 Tax=Aaosphaeria arxii CBS 175.79 TaxID=1450172 RepID=A0A6A5XAV4_9PLEO|nr:uncharacterized protein BU24DRAFT_414480 [Aaosphaeria arxii CBS 175.79]KAF2010039.1 hypothetical protein BU24DRAFT_414480 [Aaosphaeria arxii CBS 175.79]
MAGRYERHYVSAKDTGKVTDVKAHGPVPSNYSVSRNDYKRPEGKIYAARYTEKTSKRKTSEHPCSPNNRRLGFRIAEEGYQPVAVVGAIQAPFNYNTKDWKWKFHKTWADAAAAALASSGCSVDDCPYHPSDRRTVVYQHEARCASVVREMGGRSLIIVTPEIPNNAQRWNQFWDEEERPKMYARWSTGPQGTSKPIVLGCLPVWYEWNTREALWYTLEPLGSFGIDWNKNLNTKLDSLNLPCLQGIRVDTRIMKPSHLHWTIVGAHRQYVMDTYVFPKNDRGEPIFGNWIQQHLDHMKLCFQARKRSDFVFDKDRKYSGPDLDWTQLSAIVLGADNARKYAVMWDDAIDAYITYQLTQNDENWMDFSRKMRKATVWPDCPFPQK